jgi:hypothetical protein
MVCFAMNSMFLTREVNQLINPQVRESVKPQQRIQHARDAKSRATALCSLGAKDIEQHYAAEKQHKQLIDSHIQQEAEREQQRDHTGYRGDLYDGYHSSDYD